MGRSNEKVASPLLYKIDKNVKNCKKKEIAFILLIHIKKAKKGGKSVDSQ